MTPESWWVGGLWFMLVDKLLLGLVVGGVLVLAGHLLALRLERFRRAQGGVSELVKARITAVNEVYAALFDLGDALGWEEIEAIPGIDSRQVPPVPADRSETLYARASKVIARNRFLIGSSFFEAASRYLWALQKCREDLENHREIRNETWAAAEGAAATLEDATPSVAVLPESEMPRKPARARRRG